VKRREWWYILAACVSAGVYIFGASLRGMQGFPLDDAWIHQVYARNLALHAEFAFFPGQSSTGSTAPLWTLLLAIGYLLRLDFLFWAIVLGILSLGASAIVAARLAKSLCGVWTLTDQAARLVMLVPLFLLFEWHLVWAAVSGMEIAPFIFLSLLLLERSLAGANAGILGVIAGLLTLTRPEGIVLAGLVGVGFMIGRFDREGGWRNSIRGSIQQMTQYGLGLGLLITPYVLFNLIISGAILPNTFFAKTAEYASLFTTESFGFRWLRLLFTPFVGAQILLIPGLIYIAALLVMKRQWLLLIPLTWVLILPTLYAIRLPVAYQHGRYEMPVIPFIVLYGAWGTALLFGRFRQWVVQTSMVLSTSIALIAFWLLGATQYTEDVAIIDCEMVQTARWVATNVPEKKVIAAHDIGALGYITDRSFIDLAGLVTPDVIPFIRDEKRLRDFLLSRHTDYIIVFPDWYTSFRTDSDLLPVHQTNCIITREAGGTNMIVYEVRSTPSK
jgi:hypothetical protein